MEVFLDPRVIELQQLVYRTYHDTLVEQHGDAITSRIKAVQIVGDHENRDAKALVQALDQLVVVRSADRVEPGGRLVEEQHVRVERQGAGKAGALAHAPRKLRGLLVAGVRRQPDHRYLQRGNVAHQLLVKADMLADRHDDILGDTQRGE